MRKPILKFSTCSCLGFVLICKCERSVVVVSLFDRGPRDVMTSPCRTSPSENTPTGNYNVTERALVEEGRSVLEATLGRMIHTTFH